MPNNFCLLKIISGLSSACAGGLQKHFLSFSSSPKRVPSKQLHVFVGKKWVEPQFNIELIFEMTTFNIRVS